MMDSDRLRDEAKRIRGEAAVSPQLKLEQHKIAAQLEIAAAISQLAEAFEDYSD